MLLYNCILFDIVLVFLKHLSLERSQKVLIEGIVESLQGAKRKLCREGHDDSNGGEFTTMPFAKDDPHYEGCNI